MALYNHLPVSLLHLAVAQTLPTASSYYLHFEPKLYLRQHYVLFKSFDFKVAFPLWNRQQVTLAILWGQSGTLHGWSPSVTLWELGYFYLLLATLDRRGAIFLWAGGESASIWQQ